MRFPRTVAWRRVDLDHGLGLVRVATTGGEFVANGAEVCIQSGHAWGVWFALSTDDGWLTKNFAATATSSAGTKFLALEADGQGSWARRVGDETTPAPELSGCIDVDIVSTPFTNTLPIRRLALTVGESADIRAAWVDVPSLDVSVSNQRYTRLEPADGVDRYEFLEIESGDTYLLTVDEDGLVIDYERFAQRVGGVR